MKKPACITKRVACHGLIRNRRDYSVTMEIRDWKAELTTATTAAPPP